MLCGSVNNKKTNVAALITSVHAGSQRKQKSFAPEFCLQVTRLKKLYAHVHHIPGSLNPDTLLGDLQDDKLGGHTVMRDAAL